jgi:tetratricopeptide (TPR) repeat protein
MLELIREFALERLEASGEGEALRERHAAWFHTLALRAEASVFGPERARWLRAITSDQDNVRALFSRALADGDLEVGLDTAAAVMVWFASGALGEGRRWLEHLLAQPAAAAPSRARARALRVLGWIISEQAEFATARATLGESIALWRTLGDPRELAMALQQFAFSSREVADQASALAAAEEALHLAREVADPVAAAFALNQIGRLAFVRRDFAAARAALEEEIEIARGLGDASLQGGALGNLATVDVAQGDDESAVARLTEALALMRTLGEHAQMFLVTGTLLGLGEIAYRRRYREGAAAHFGEALEHSRRIGAIGNRVHAIHGLGRVAFLCQDWELAARLISAAEALREAHKIVPLTSWPGKRHQVAAEIEAALGEDAFASAWAAGAALSLDQATDEALAVAATMEDREPIGGG